MESISNECLNEDKISERVNNFKALVDSDSEPDTTIDTTDKQPEFDKSMQEDSHDSDSDGSDNHELKSPQSLINAQKSISNTKNGFNDKKSVKHNKELKVKIQSEKQRMERDQEIHVPYHRSKQYSLKEFMARRSLTKPSNERAKDKTINSMQALKKVADNIEEFALKIKNREDEAIEFFKSESESDDEEKLFPIISDLTVKETSPDEENSVLKEDLNHQVENSLSSVKTLQKSEAASESLVCDGHQTSTYSAAPVVEPNESKVTLKTLEAMKSIDVIDLETGLIAPRVKTGPEVLFQKYLKTVHIPRPRSQVCMNILTLENGILENQKVQVKLSKEIEMDHNRPGYSHEILKEKLRNQIVQKRLEELKKVKDLEIKEVTENKKYEKYEDNDSDEKDETVPENPAVSILNDEDEILDEDEEEDENEGEDEVEDIDESSDEISSSDNEETEEILEAPRKSRILKAFEDSDDEERTKTEENTGDLFSEEVPNSNLSLPLQCNDPIIQSESIIHEPFATQPSTQHSFNTQNSVFKSMESSFPEEIKTIGDLCDSGTSQVAFDELLDICSGRFSPTQETSAAVQSQAEVSQADGQPDPFSYSQFNTSVKEIPCEPETLNNKEKYLLKSSDDEAEESVTNTIRKKEKKRSMKLKKMNFSSDEEEEEESNLYLVDNTSPNLKEIVAEEEFDYDSEENEIELKTIKKDRLKAAEAYLDEEAELSESEWGSADEDEKDLNDFDKELGDEDQFDQNKLREEIARIHARKILDDDIRNVKRIEGLLFQDEENDGVGRDRKFRWKNQSKDFTLENENARDGDVVDGAGCDEESEILWRKMRHERETMLSELSQNLTDKETNSECVLLLDHNSQLVTSASRINLSKKKFSVVKTLNSINSSTDAEEPKKESPFLIKTSNIKQFSHSSFLSRDEKTLSKIARLVSSKDDEVTNSSSHGSSSMSFMTIEKPNESKKRKSGETTHQEMNKKRKLQPTSTKFLLDELS